MTPDAKPREAIAARKEMTWEHAPMSVGSGSFTFGVLLSAEERDALLATLEVAESIVNDLAAHEPVITVDGHRWCTTCDAHVPTGLSIYVEHAEDCVWRRAVELENAKKETT